MELIGISGTVSTGRNGWNYRNGWNQTQNPIFPFMENFGKLRKFSSRPFPTFPKTEHIYNHFIIGQFPYKNYILFFIYINLSFKQNFVIIKTYETQRLYQLY